MIWYDVIQSVIILVGAAMALVLLWRSRDKWPALPPWAWRNIIALTSLVATIVGAAVLVRVAWWVLDQFATDADRLITELVRDPKVRPEVGQVLIIIYEAMAWGLKLVLVGMLLVVLSLGLAITQRRLKADKTGFEFSGGDEEPKP